MIEKSEARDIFLRIVKENYNNLENDNFDENIIKPIFTLDDISEIANSFWDVKDKSRNDGYKNVVGEIIEKRAQNDYK